MSYVQLFPTHMLSLEFVLGFCYGIAKGEDCKVEILSTILLALFHAKFACILAISNPVFRWESCKNSEWDSVKKCSRLCKDVKTRGWDLRVTRDWQATNCNTRVKRAKKMNSHASWSTIGQKVQPGRSVNSQLELATQSSRKTKPLASSVWEKLTLRIPFSPHYI